MPAEKRRASFPRTSVLGVEVQHCTYDGVVEEIARLAREERRGAVAFCNVHMVMTAWRDAEFRSRINSFELLCPDGQPVRWAVNLLGQAGLQDRVYGPSLMLRLCCHAAKTGLGVYLYGSYPETSRLLRERLEAQVEGLRIVGRRPSRFRPATEEEDRDDIDTINASSAEIVFVGMGCPLQENWAWERRDRIRGVLVCVGAAFDFHSGTVPQAPRWMQRSGLEWLFRFAAEPRRLWRRYLLNNPLYLLLVARQWAGRKRSRQTSRNAS